MMFTQFSPVLDPHFNSSSESSFCFPVPSEFSAEPLQETEFIFQTPDSHCEPVFSSEISEYPSQEDSSQEYERLPMITNHFGHNYDDDFEDDFDDDFDEDFEEDFEELPDEDFQDLDFSDDSGEDGDCSSADNDDSYNDEFEDDFDDYDSDENTYDNDDSDD